MSITTVPKTKSYPKSIPGISATIQSVLRIAKPRMRTCAVHADVQKRYRKSWQRGNPKIQRKPLGDQTRATLPQTPKSHDTVNTNRIERRWWDFRCFERCHRPPQNRKHSCKARDCKTTQKSPSGSRRFECCEWQNRAKGMDFARSTMGENTSKSKMPASFLLSSRCTVTTTLFTYIYMCIYIYT